MTSIARAAPARCAVLQELWQCLCEDFAARMPPQVWDPAYTLAALRLHGYRTLRASPTHEARDAHEILLHGILHRATQGGGATTDDWRRRMRTVLHQEPHCVLEALCMLRRHLPDTARLLCRADDDLRTWWSTHPSSLQKIVPVSWDLQNKPAEAVEVAVSLIRSVEIWLEAIFNVIQ